MKFTEEENKLTIEFEPHDTPVHKGMARGRFTELRYLVGYMQKEKT